MISSVVPTVNVRAQGKGYGTAMGDTTGMQILARQLLRVLSISISSW